MALRRFGKTLALCASLALSAASCASRTPPPAEAPVEDAHPASDFGVLLMAHGGTPEWNAAVVDAVKPLQEKYTLEIAFGMADAASLQDAIRKLEARKVRNIGVVRLFISGESFLQETEQIFGLRPGAPAPANAGGVEHPVLASQRLAAGPGGEAHGAGKAHGGEAGHAGPGAGGAHGHGAGHGGGHAGHGAGGHGGHSMAFFRVETRASFALSTHGLADASGMGAVLADRAAAISRSPEQEDVLILAHGPGDDAENERWLAKLDERAAAVRARAPFRRVQVETLREDWPDKRASAEERVRAFVRRASAEGGKAIVIPFRVQGFGPYAKVLDGLDYVADQRGLLPHAEVTQWIGQEVSALASGPFRRTL